MLAHEVLYNLDLGALQFIDRSVQRRTTLPRKYFTAHDALAYRSPTSKWQVRYRSTLFVVSWRFPPELRRAASCSSQAWCSDQTAILYYHRHPILLIFLLIDSACWQPSCCMAPCRFDATRWPKTRQKAGVGLHIDSKVRCEAAHPLYYPQAGKGQTQTD